MIKEEEKQPGEERIRQPRIQDITFYILNPYIFIIPGVARAVLQKSLSFAD